MKKVTIDITGISTGEGVHDAVARALELPSQYGKELDSLYASLRNLALPVTVVWKSNGALSEEAHDAALDIYSVLEDFSVNEPAFILEG